MSSYKHQQTVRLLKELDAPPRTRHEVADWIRAKSHLGLLMENTWEDEVILYASTPRVAFIYAVIASEREVTPPNYRDLLKWNGNPYSSRAGYSYTLASHVGGVKFENNEQRFTPLLHAQNIVFGRDRGGIDDDDPIYYELLQEFEHAAGLHWRDDQQAYCSIDENGDVEPVVCITKRSDTEPVALITCKRKPLEIFLAASGWALVRVFDITMVDYEKFDSWDEGIKKRVIESKDLFYDQCVHPEGHAYTRGVQVLHPSLSRQELFNLVAEPRPGREDRQHAKFKIMDWRHKNLATVSTHPGDTTNYFEAGNNDLPFEVSPAFFRPEVLSRYKADRDKYVIDEVGRWVSCRGTWSLKGYDVNDAGQVHAYICYLRSLPYEEQLHWQIHNEEPKGTISRRAFENDIQGEWASYETPLELERTIRTLQQWDREEFSWWNIPNADDLLKLNTPVADNRDEWAGAFLEVAQSVIEKFRPKALRELLDQRGIDYEKDARSLALLERLIEKIRLASGRTARLEGLREAQMIRTKVRAHDGGKERTAISRAALKDHGTYRAHFERVCNLIADELEEIEACITNAYTG